MTAAHFVNLLAEVTLIEMMVTLGLGVKISDVLAVGREWSLVLIALLANYVIVPGAAIGLLLLFHASPMVAAGFMVAAVCPGAPYAPPFTSMARGNVTVAIGLMIALCASSAVIAPLLLKFLLPLVVGQTAVKINVLKMIGTLLGAQLIPLCIGLWIRYSRPRSAERLQKIASVISLVLNLILLAIIIAVQFNMLSEIHVRGYIGMTCLVLASLFAGAVVAKRLQRAILKSMIMTTSVRNVGVSLVIATSSFPGTAAVTTATAYAIFQTVVIALVAFALGRFSRDMPMIVQKAA